MQGDPRKLLDDPKHKERFEESLDNPYIASREELDKLPQMIADELAWWGNEPPYAENADISAAAADGRLVRVQSDENFKLIMRFENPELDDWQPYLSEETADLLKEVIRRWRARAKQNGIGGEIQLAVTSLTRSKSYQDKIRKAGKLAAENSSHTKGQSFDIDGCGYYKDGIAVNPRFTRNYKDDYNPAVHSALREVLDEMCKENKLNYIPEYEGTENQCFHITRNPQSGRMA